MDVAAFVLENILETGIALPCPHCHKNLEETGVTTGVKAWVYESYTPLITDSRIDLDSWGDRDISDTDDDVVFYCRECSGELDGDLKEVLLEGF